MAALPHSDADIPSHRSATWFYRRNGISHGPVSLADLRATVILGFLGPRDLVRQAGSAQWRPAAHVTAVTEQLFHRTKKDPAP